MCGAGGCIREGGCYVWVLLDSEAFAGALFAGVVDFSGTLSPFAIIEFGFPLLSLPALLSFLQPQFKLIVCSGV